MSVRNKERICAAAVCALAAIFVGDLVVVPLAFDERPICERAAEWVDAHRGSLPSTLEELAAFPSGYRLAILNALPPDTKARLWKERVQIFAQRPDLTPVQQAAVQEVLTRIDTNLWNRDTKYDALRHETEKALGAGITAAFGKSEITQGLTLVGPVEAVPSVGRGGLLQLSEKVRGLFAANAAQQPPCQCGSTQDCVRYGGGMCTFGSCTTTWTCGWCGCLGCGGRCLG
jgi:hypothetical protein